MTAAARHKSPAQHVPQSIEQVEADLATIARLTADVKSHHDALARHVIELRDRTVALTTPVEAEIERLSNGIRAFAEARRAELTRDGRKKSVKLVNGTISWRKSRPRVVLTAKEDDVLVALRTMRLGHFIRTVEEVDKVEMLRSPADARRVPGVTIDEGEETIAVEANVCSTEDAR